MNHRRFFTALLIAVNFIAPTLVNAQSAAIIRVATGATFVPFGFSKDGKRTGFPIALTETLANEGMTMLVVTHEMGFAREVADVVVVMDHGRIVESGPPDQIFVNPREERTRSFLQAVLSRNQAVNGA